MKRDEALRFLGLESNATLDDAKRAYRDLVKVTHPDKDASAGAKQRFILIQDAYEVITKAEKARLERERKERERERKEREREERKESEGKEGKHTSGKRAQGTRAARAQGTRAARAQGTRAARKERAARAQGTKQQERKEREQQERKEREQQERKEKVQREVEAYVFSCLERGVEKVTKLKQYGAAIRDFDDALTRAGQSYIDESKTLTRCLSDAYCWRGMAMYYIIQDNPMSRTDPYSVVERHILNIFIRYEDIIEDFSEAIRLRPDNTGAYYWRGRMKYENARVAHWSDNVVCEYATSAYESIVQDFDKAISLRPDHAGAYYWRGRVKCSRVVFTAISAFENWGKGYEEMVVRIGSVQREGVMETESKMVKMVWVFNAAVQDFNEVVRLRPHCVDAYYWRGISRYFLEQYEAAVQDFDEVIRLRPNYAGAYNWRGNAKFGLKQNDAARHDYEKANALATETNMTFDSWGEPL